MEKFLSFFLSCLLLRYEQFAIGETERESWGRLGGRRAARVIYPAARSSWATCHATLGPPLFSRHFSLGARQLDHRPLFTRRRSIQTRSCMLMPIS